MFTTVTTMLLASTFLLPLSSSAPAPVPYYPDSNPLKLGNLPLTTPPSGLFICFFEAATCQGTAAPSNCIAANYNAQNLEFRDASESEAIVFQSFQLSRRLHDDESLMLYAPKIVANSNSDSVFARNCVGGVKEQTLTSADWPVGVANETANTCLNTGLGASCFILGKSGVL